MKPRMPVLLLSLMLVMLVQPGAHADDPVAHVVLFWSATCPHCHVVLNETMPVLQEQFGDRLDVLVIEASTPEGYQVWVEALDTFQVPAQRQGVPMLIAGDQVLVGEDEIASLLPALIEDSAATGGLDYPAIPGLASFLRPTPTPPATAGPTATGAEPAPSAIPRPTPTVKACHICGEDIVVGDDTASPTATQEACTGSVADDCAPTSPTPDAVVHLWLFYDSGCDPCMTLRQEVLPSILKQYAPGQVVVRESDVAKSDYELMVALERQQGLTYGDMPEIFVGDEVVRGDAEIRARLKSLIDHYLAQGGVPVPQVRPTPTAVTPGHEDTPAAIHMAYFYQPGCRECDRVALDLNYLQNRYAELVVHEFGVEANAALAEWMGQRAGVPEGKRLTAPSAFVGDDALVGDDVHARNLEELLSRHANPGAEAFWEGWEESQEQAAESIVSRFRSLGALTVLAAGLVDGLNPCAFATIVFFISYLAFMERKGREILAVGAAFALGVFLAYLGVGFGLLKFLTALPFLSAISRWIYGLTAVLCLALAGGSLYDWWQARRGKPQDMQLKLPTRLRRSINRVIREGAQMRAFVGVALVSGVVISLIELACTGQVYLPTIVFVLGVPELKAKAGLYLVLYNIMFVLPLVVVFTLAYFGVSSQRLGVFIHRRAAHIKLATAALFVALGGWLLATFF